LGSCLALAPLALFSCLLVCLFVRWILRPHRTRHTKESPYYTRSRRTLSSGGAAVWVRRGWSPACRRVRVVSSAPRRELVSTATLSAAFLCVCLFVSFVVFLCRGACRGMIAIIWSWRGPADPGTRGLTGYQVNCRAARTPRNLSRGVPPQRSQTTEAFALAQVCLGLHR